MIVETPDSIICYVEIPKTGTQSVCKGITNSLNQRFCKGHKSMSYLLGKAPRDGRPIEFVATLRNPYERFLSALNYVAMHREAPLQDHIEKSIEGRGRYGQVFRPYRYWLDLPNGDLKLFTTVNDTLEYLGIPKVYHENKSDKFYSMKNLEAWSDYIEEAYSSDIALWSRTLDRIYSTTTQGVA